MSKPQQLHALQQIHASTGGAKACRHRHHVGLPSLLLDYTQDRLDWEKENITLQAL